eukprot:5629875-Alexandrium_andersonii.AAC.1
MPYLTELYGAGPPKYGWPEAIDHLAELYVCGSAQRAPECRAVFLQNLRTVLLLGLVRPGRLACVRAPDDPEPCEPRLGPGPASAPSWLSPPRSPPETPTQDGLGPSSLGTQAGGRFPGVYKISGLPK